MKEKTESKGIGRLFANIKAFFSRKNKKQSADKRPIDEVSSEQSNVVDNSLSVTSVEPEKVSSENVEQSNESSVDDGIEENVISSELPDSDSDIETSVADNSEQTDLITRSLTPQQEYVSNRNMKVGVSEITIRSFVAKISSVNPEIQSYYNDLKNYVLSFAGTRCRTSWQYDSFYKTKVLLARFVVKGKSLWLYVALDENEIPQGTNCAFTKDRKYVGIEAGLKIQGQRTFKQAKILLKSVCEKQGLSFAEREIVNYIPDKMTDDEMLEKGLIKKILTSTNVALDE